MKCSECQFNDTRVIESREASEGDAIRRRRECPACSQRFTTYERIERPELIVVKSDGTRQVYNREKLLRGLYRACEKTTVTGIQIERLVGRIERELYELGEQEVASKQIGQAVMDQLANLNDVAYVRFASVYRRFADIAGFERELSEIRKRREEKVKSKEKVLITK